TYTVSLVVTDDKDADSAEVTKEITVSGPERTVIYSYPNPASTQASIVYYLPTGATDPVLRIYNITGALVFEQELTAGASPYVWNLNSTGGTPQPNGLYLCVVVAKNAGGGTIKSPTFKLLIAR
ncbi:MAG TPA: T9SS type A sorting domain-containing protein, partial [Candidatus Acetothermia bacterium]|nr:T9SS type A sorting domain-containing protein [Candidatus Acetothermia bacterium]